MILEIILLLLIILTCLYASITDIKYSVILNRYLIAVATMGVIIDVIYYLKYSYLLPIFIFNFALAIVSSIILYASHIWAAGDSKLLIVLGLLIPARYTIYDNGYLFEILIPIYAFAVSFVYLIIDTAYMQIKTKRSLPIDNIKKQFKSYINRLIINCIYIITIVKIENVLLGKFGITSLGVFQVVINIFILILISNIQLLHKKTSIICTVIVSIIISAVTGNWMVSLSRIGYYVVVALFILIRIVVSEYNYAEISIDNLKTGMILSTYTTLLFAESKVKGLPKISKEDLRSRLTAEEVEAIKRWQKSKYGQGKVTIVKKVPFAIFITIGLMIYMVLGVFLRCTSI
jgi:preflagellin peptidase FlaK